MMTPEFLVRRLPAPAASLLCLLGGELEPAIEKLDQLLDGVSLGRAALQGPRAFSLGGAEWLLLEHSRETVRRTVCAMARALVQVSDISRSLVSLRIEGPASRTILGIGTDAIWTGTAQSAGQYARTRLDDAAVVLHCIAPDVFELHAERDPRNRVERWIRHRQAARLLPRQSSFQ